MDGVSGREEISKGKILGIIIKEKLTLKRKTNIKKKRDHR